MSCYKIAGIIQVRESYLEFLLREWWSDEGIRILQDTIAQCYSFETRLTDYFDSILREIESILVLEDSEDKLVEQFDDLVTIDIIGDENEDN